MKKRNIIKTILSTAVILCAGTTLNAQCSFTGLDTTYCSDAEAVTLTGSPEGGEFVGSGITGSTFDPASAGSGDHEVSYNYEIIKESYYLRSAVGEPWMSTANPSAMDLVFGSGEWILDMFETLDPIEVFSEGTGFVYIDGSDNGASELAAFLATNLSLIEDWVDGGGRLLMNAAPNEGGDINFGFGASTLAYDSPSGSVNVADLTHPAYLGPNTPIVATMTGSNYSHGHILGTGFTNVLVNSVDATNIVLCEKSWGAGHVMLGGMTTNNFHAPLAESANWRANLLHYMNNATSRFYLRASIGEPWGSASNTNAMNLAFGTGQWTLDFFETLDPEAIFSSNTSFVFMDGSDNGASELNAFLIDNLEIIEDWVSLGGSLLMNAAPNEGGDIDFGFDGSVLIYADPSSSVTVDDLAHPAYLGPNSPTAVTMTGSNYSHGHITGSDFTTVLANSADATNIVLCEKVWGNGNIMMGGMTMNSFHSPLLEANNYRANLMVHMSELYDGYVCTATQVVTVLEPLVISSTTGDEISGSDGSIDIIVTGGYPDYVFDWDNDGSGDFDDTEDLTGLVAGTYVVTVEDEWGCTATETIVVNSQVGIATESKLAIKLYPNPTQGETVLEMEGDFTYVLYDMNGKTIVQGSGFNKETLELSELENGIYFIQVAAKDLTQTIKVIKK
ncbi:MAG: hypothetical protein ACI8ZM_001725 [Crocinitomix sp.]|jgi:hypothetical protein